MLYPTIEQFGGAGSDRYAVTVATAKCARIVTDEYCRQRETAERMVSQKETDKTVFALIDKDIRDNKAVKTAINRMMEGELVVLEADENGELKPILMSAQLAKQAEAEGAEQADE
ncbi:MAG: hypothetical protein E7599_00930 [Ruminococcaceae bacterium]|nr:hypothetical protein [Oscillospiraceae bacterium]